jgi:hypothetical protein
LYESTAITHSLRADGFDALEDGTGRGTPIIAVAIPILEAGARTGKSTDDVRAGIGIGQDGDPMFTLQSGKQHAVAFRACGQDGFAPDEIAPPIASTDGGGAGVPTICFDTTQITSKANRSNPKTGDPCHPLASGAHPPAIGFCNSAGDTNLSVSEDTFPPVTTRHGDPGMVAFSCKDHGADAGQIAPTLRSMGHDGSHANGGGQIAVAFNVAENDTLQYNGISHASTQENHTGKILHLLLQEVGEEAFAEWGLGVFNSLQPPQILRSDLHGESIRCEAGDSGPIVGDGPLSRTEDMPKGSVLPLWQTEGFGCSPQRRELAEQLTREFGADLSELPYSASSQETFLSGMWEASEGIFIMRQALSALQEIWRSATHQGQSVCSDSIRNGIEPKQGVCGFGVRQKTPCQWLLSDACSAVQERDTRDKQQESGRCSQKGVGNQTFAVRRLIPEECEILQGFPVGFTNITFRGKEAADGPRYKALGNSMAVPVLAWIGRRIMEAAA